MGKAGSELFLVDNSDADCKVLRYLHNWGQLAKGIDIVTGYLEVGSLLGLKDQWHKVDRIRLLMGDEVSKRAKAAFESGPEGLRWRLNGSVERERKSTTVFSPACPPSWRPFDPVASNAACTGKASFTPKPTSPTPGWRSLAPQPSLADPTSRIPSASWPKLIKSSRSTAGGQACSW